MRPLYAASMSAAAKIRRVFLNPPRVVSGTSHAADLNFPVVSCTRVSIKMCEIALAVSHNPPTALSIVNIRAVGLCQ